MKLDVAERHDSSYLYFLDTIDPPVKLLWLPSMHRKILRCIREPVSHAWCEATSLTVTLQNFILVCFFRILGLAKKNDRLKTTPISFFVRIGGLLSFEMPSNIVIREHFASCKSMMQGSLLARSYIPFLFFEIYFIPLRIVLLILQSDDIYWNCIRRDT